MSQALVISESSWFSMGIIYNSDSVALDFVTAQIRKGLAGRGHLHTEMHSYMLLRPMKV